MRKENSNPQKTIHANCAECNEPLVGKQTKFCSKKCCCNATNNKHQNYVAQQNRGKTRKKELVEILGGKCKECNYFRNYAALSFHHRNPSEKSFGLDMRACSNRTWAKLLEEAKKCDLLCIRCHLELHNPDYFV
jgi:hypothetical protein